MAENDADARFAEGVRLFDAGGYEGAIKEFSAIIAADPDHQEARRYRTDAYHALARKRAKEEKPQLDDITRIGADEGEGSFWGGVSAVSIPVILLSALSTIGERFYWLWYISAGVFVVGIIAAFIIGLSVKPQTGKGITMALLCRVSAQLDTIEA